MTLDNATDEALLARIASGDRDAMSVLFRRRQQQVFRFALHLTGAAAIADDVTQDVFVAVIRDAARFEPGRSTVIAWLCGIARNFVRRRFAEPDTDPLELEDADAAPAITPDPVGDLTQGEMLESLRRAVLSLPIRYREVIVLCDLQEMPYAEAAGVVGCAVGTVRSRLHRGRALLTEKMQVERRRQQNTTVRMGTTRYIA
jgi:RNA polymerase sigma-70 factor (ECF subfamily)